MDMIRLLNDFNVLEIVVCAKGRGIVDTLSFSECYLRVHCV